MFAAVGGLDSVQSLDTNTVASIPSVVDVAPAVRKYFPETWIWDCKTVRFVG